MNQSECNCRSRDQCVVDRWNTSVAPLGMAFTDYGLKVAVPVVNCEVMAHEVVRLDDDNADDDDDDEATT